VQGRGALKRKLVCVPADRPGAAGAARPLPGRGKGFVIDEIMISKRPAEADDRAVPVIGRAI
jgi:hypothetical protein